MRDLAAQLGVARGAARLTYDRLSNAQPIVASRTTGTAVADRRLAPVEVEERPDLGSFMDMYDEVMGRPRDWDWLSSGVVIVNAFSQARVR